MNRINSGDQTKGQNGGSLKAFKEPRMIVAMVLIVVLVGIVSGGGVYLWRDSLRKDIQNNLNGQIANLENELNEASTKAAQSDEALGERDQRILELNQSLDQAATQEAQLEQLLCKGAWVDGECLLNTCIDSDVAEMPNDIYISGAVTTTDHRGVATTVYDECTGSKHQVNEMWCYESPKGSGNYVMGRMIYDCPLGCAEGACIKDN